MIAQLHEILDVGFKMDVLLFHWDFKLLSGDGGLCNREWLKYECEHIEKESGKKQRERELKQFWKQTGHQGVTWLWLINILLVHLNN